MTYTHRFTRSALPVFGAAFLIVSAGCIDIKDKDSPGKDAGVVTQVADSSDISAPSYDDFALDTAGMGAREIATPADDSAYSQISERTLAAPLTRFPARIPKQGPTALQIQVLLDRAHFSPGILDGKWGDNAAKALAFFRTPEDSTGSGIAALDSAALMDQATYQRLRAAAGSVPVLTRYTVTADDMKGPFAKIPDNVYEQAKLNCLCYASAIEGIAEKFHTSQKLLKQLNPTADLAGIKAGTKLVVPNIEVTDLLSTGGTVAAGDAAATTSGGQIARLIISKKGYWTHAVDAAGKTLYHFPSTLGAGYDPSPDGVLSVTRIAWNPTFHYQPTLFAEVSNSKPEAQLPKGPNSPVGVVWMALSKPHYGIHGTSSPETIGYANSHGCVRLTNWDAAELGGIISSGVEVQFR